MDITKAKILYDAGTPIRDERTKRWLKLQTPFLPFDALPKQCLWHIVHDINEIPLCKMCDNKVSWDSANSFANQKYCTYCCRKCGLSDPERVAKKIKTELLRYGKGRPEIIKKIKKTNNERYGVDFANKLLKYQEKRKNTNLKKYGCISPLNNHEIRKKRDLTNLQKYGVFQPAQSEQCKKKTQETLLKKYGGHQGLRHFDEKSKSHYNDKNWLFEQHITNKRSAVDISNELMISSTAVLNKIRSFGIPFQYYSTPQSLLEKKLINFVTLFNIPFVEGDRTILRNKELDIYFPTLKIAIEFNGIYWHGELQGRTKNYHLNKTELCLDQGIQLLHISENEWVLKNNITKSIISNKLNKTPNTLYARKCKVIELDNQQTRNFLNDNHIQGYRNSSINLGLTYEDKLVSVLTLSKPRYSKKHEYEIYRFCNILDTRIIGGASKLFSYFVKEYNPASVITYADRRFGEGNVYKQLGFVFSHNSVPNYHYFKKGQIDLHSRVSFQKHKLEKKLDIFNPLLSEWENMVNNGYDRIWDCGNAVWEYYKAAN